MVMRVKRRATRAAVAVAVAVAVAALLAGCGIDGTGSPQGTQTAQIHLLADSQRVNCRSGAWSTFRPTRSTVPSWTPSPSAMGPDIQSCAPGAAGAGTCWAPPDQPYLYCGKDPYALGADDPRGSVVRGAGARAQLVVDAEQAGVTLTAEQEAIVLADLETDARHPPLGPHRFRSCCSRGCIGPIPPGPTPNPGSTAHRRRRPRTGQHHLATPRLPDTPTITRKSRRHRPRHL